MTAASPRDEAPRAPWGLLAYATLFVAVASAHLLWLLWRYVPLHASVFAGMGIELPRGTLVTIMVSNWAIRLFPFGLILSVPLAALTAALLVVFAMRRELATVARPLAVFGLVVAFSESVAAAFVVHSVHAGYSVAASNPRFQESLRAFEQFRKEHAEKRPPP